MTSKSEGNFALNQDNNNKEKMCLELALEGERLCKIGDCRAGVAYLHAAMSTGTSDLHTLSAIYSQMGNAYFYLGDYARSMEFHTHDLTLARTIHDKLGEAKSSGNLGNALKAMGRFDEAIIFSKRQLEISREINDKLGEGRALYNLANVYHAKGKHIGRLEDMEPGVFPDDVKAYLEQAIKYYEENLQLMKELGDVAAQGRACGNLGNTNYLLGKFREAIYYHNERLQIALEFNDKPAERRANSNLGNSHIFIGEFQKAVEYYKRTLVIAQELQETAVIGQSCYSLGNTYTLLHDYESAIEYHLNHYSIAQQLEDRVGEGRACWSLGNAYSALGDFERAIHYAKQHLRISIELDDFAGQASAHMNIIDLQKAMGMKVDDISADTMRLIADAADEAKLDPSSPGLRRYTMRRKSMENLDLIKLTPDKENTKLKIPINNSSYISSDDKKEVFTQNNMKEEDDSFFDLLSRFQSKRMDDQRCSLSVKSTRSGTEVEPPLSDNVDSPDIEEELMDLIIGIQSRRMDEQRVELPNLPGLRSCGSRLLNSVDEQRNILGKKQHLDVNRQTLQNVLDEESCQKSKKKSTVPDEDLFTLIARLQSGRMDDQRATLNPTD